MFVDKLTDRIDELERKLTSLDLSNEISCSEYCSKFENTSFNSEKTIISPFFSAKVGNSLVFQIKVDLTLASADTIDIALIFGEYEIYSESYELSSGSHSLFIMKSSGALTSSETSLTIKIKPAGTFSHTLNSVRYFVWGAESYTENEVKLSADILGSHLAVAYVFSNQLFAHEYTTMPTQIAASDLTYFLPAIDVALCFLPSGELPVLHVLRVDELKNLNHSLFSTLNSETLVDTDVTSVAAESIFEGEISVAYIKSGKAYFRSYKNGTFSEPILLPLPESNTYKRVSIIKNSSFCIMIIVSAESGANFLIKSSKEVSSSTENINLKLTSLVFV